MTPVAAPERAKDCRHGSDASDSSGQDRLYRNVLSSWAVYAVFVITGFFMPRLIDRHLGQATLGVWDLGWSVVAYLSLTPLGVGSAVIRYVARYRTRGEWGPLATMTASAFAIQLVAAVLSLLLAVAIAILVPDPTGSVLGDPGSQNRWVILLLGLGAAIHIAFDMFRGVITGSHRWDLHNALNAGSHLFTVLAMVSTLTFGGDIVSLALAALAVTFLVELARARVAYSICPHLSINLRRANLRTVHRLLRFGVKSFIVDASGLILYQSANILIASHLGPVALAAFARPLALVRHVTVIVNKYAYVLAPTASSLQAEGRSDGLSALVLRTTHIAAYLALPMILGLGILGDSILEVWMGPSYRLGPVLTVLAAGHLLPIVQEPLVSILTGTNAHGRAGLALAAAALLAIVFATFALGQAHWGLFGAAVSITLPLTLAKGVYLPLAACKQLHLPFRRYLAGAVLRPALLLSPLAVVLIGCRLIFPAQPLLTLGWAFILGSLVVLPVWWYELLSPLLRARIRARLVSSWRCARGQLTPTRPALARRPLFRTGVLWLCRAIGLLCLWRWLHRHELVILTVHGVMDDLTPATWAPLRPQLAPHILDRAVTVLRRHYRFVSLATAVDMLAGRRPLQPYSLVLTFDDGYRNNLTHALPILRRHGVPATLFLATGHVEHRRPFWFDRLDYAIQQAPVGGRTLVVNGVPIEFPSSARSSLDSAYRRLRATAKASHRSDADTVGELEALSRDLEAESCHRLLDIFERDPWSAVATWDDLRAEAGLDLEIGSHTVDHVRLHLADADTAREQLVRSKHMIETRLGQPCRYLCYPNGDFDARTVAFAQACGYEAALTTITGSNRRGADLFSLRRRTFPETSSATELLCHISGLSGLLARAITPLRRLASRRALLAQPTHSRQP